MTPKLKLNPKQLQETHNRGWLQLLVAMAAGTESNTAGAAETGEKWTSWKLMELSDTDAGDDSLHDRGKTSNMSMAAAAQSKLPDIAVHHHQLLLLLQTPAISSSAMVCCDAIVSDHPLYK